MSYAHQVRPPLIGTVASAAAEYAGAQRTPFGGTDYNGSTVKITSGTGHWTDSKVLSNDASTLTLTSPWTTSPDTTSELYLGTGVDSYSGPPIRPSTIGATCGPDFQNAFGIWGTRSGKGLGAGVEVERRNDLADYVDLRRRARLHGAHGRHLRRAGRPAQADGEEISKGRDLTVYVSAADDGHRRGVRAFDADGDGTWKPTKWCWPAATPTVACTKRRCEASAATSARAAAGPGVSTRPATSRGQRRPSKSLTITPFWPSCSSRSARPCKRRFRRSP